MLEVSTLLYIKVLIVASVGSQA